MWHTSHCWHHYIDGHQHAVSLSSFSPLSLWHNDRPAAPSHSRYNLAACRPVRWSSLSCQPPSPQWMMLHSTPHHLYIHFALTQHCRRHIPFLMMTHLVKDLPPPTCWGCWWSLVAWPLSYGRCAVVWSCACCHAEWHHKVCTSEACAHVECNQGVVVMVCILLRLIYERLIVGLVLCS